MENVPMISVIVPVYMVEAYLDRCIQSIVSQTYQNLEILLIDDGSKDGSGAVCDAWLSRDSRIRVIHKENGGVTSARFCGIAAAKGQWLGFVDGDDCIDPEMYAHLLQNAQKHGADISHCGQKMIYSDGRVHSYYDTGVLRIQDTATGVRDLLEERIVEPGLCNKLYRKALFSELDRQMDTSIKNNEDFLMNYYLFSKAEKSVFEDICFYHYMIREDSASRKKLNANRIYDPILVKEIILRQCGPELKEDAQRAMAATCLYVYSLLVRETDPEYKADKEKVRSILRRQKKYLKILPLKSKVLVILVCDAPVVFEWIYGLYRLLRKRS